MIPSSWTSHATDSSTRDAFGGELAKMKGVITAAMATESGPRPTRATHCVVSGAHAFVLRISSIVGLAPLRFEAGSNGFTISISNAKCIYSYLLIAVLVIGSIIGLTAELNAGVNISVRMNSQMSQVILTTDVLVVAVTAIAGVYGAPRRMRKMLKFMEHIASVDTSIGSQYSTATDRKLCSVIVAVLIYFSTLIVNDYAFYAGQAIKLGKDWHVMTNYIGFYLMWFIVMILELQFTFTALTVSRRFAAINDALALTSRLVHGHVDKPNIAAPLNIYAVRVAPADLQCAANINLLVDTMTGGEKEKVIIIKKTVRGEPRLIVSPVDAVRRLSSLHSRLCDVVNTINDSYGLPVIVILISTLLHLIVTPYSLILDIISSSNRIDFIVLAALWCTIHMLRVILIIEPGHHTVNEARRTEGLVCRLMSSAPSTGALPARLEIFSRQLMLQSISYSPMGICTLHRPLIATAVGAVMTYLVIFIQFQK